MSALPVEPSPKATPPGSVPGRRVSGLGIIESSALARTYPSPDPWPIRAEELYELPQEVWVKDRRCVILRRVPHFLDSSRVSFLCRWLDQERTWTWSPYANHLLLRIGMHDTYGSHPDWVRKNVDPDADYAKEDRRRARWDR
jgi:hypothetical protein